MSVLALRMRSSVLCNSVETGNSQGFQFLSLWNSRSTCSWTEPTTHRSQNWKEKSNMDHSSWRREEKFALTFGAQSAGFSAVGLDTKVRAAQTPIIRARHRIHVWTVCKHFFLLHSLHACKLMFVLSTSWCQLSRVYDYWIHLHNDFCLIWSFLAHRLTQLKHFSFGVQSDARGS